MCPGRLAQPAHKEIRETKAILALPARKVCRVFKECRANRALPARKVCKARLGRPARPECRDSRVT